MVSLLHGAFDCLRHVVLARDDSVKILSCIPKLEIVARMQILFDSRTQRRPRPYIKVLHGLLPWAVDGCHGHGLSLMGTLHPL